MLGMVTFTHSLFSGRRKRIVSIMWPLTFQCTAACLSFALFLLFCRPPLFWYLLIPTLPFLSFLSITVTRLLLPHLIQRSSGKGFRRRMAKNLSWTQGKRGRERAKDWSGSIIFVSLRSFYRSFIRSLVATFFGSNEKERERERRNWLTSSPL